jgi:hypothetical protein
MILLSLPMVKWQQAKWNCSRSKTEDHHIVPRVSPDGTQRRSLREFNIMDFLGVRM